MKTSIECLPIELWVDVFSFLEAHQLLRAFTNLNRHFDHILTSNHILFRAHFDKDDRNPLEYARQPYWPVFILHRIVSLRPIVPDKLSHLPEFLRWHCGELTHLKSLTVKLRGREIPPICNVLPRLDSLRCLMIDCVPTQNLLDAILATPNLKVGRFAFSRPIQPIHTSSNYISPVEVLVIHFQDNSRGSVMNLLLSHMPRLRKLELKNTDLYVKNREWLFFDALFILPELRTIDMQCMSNYSTPVIFQSLHHTLPAVKSAFFNISLDFIDDAVVNHLIYHWWPVFESIEQITVVIKCRNEFGRLNDVIRANLNDLREVLLAMNHQYDGSVEAKWNERFHLHIQIIEISICKNR